MVDLAQYYTNMNKYTALLSQASNSNRRSENHSVNNIETCTPKQILDPKRFANMSQRFMCSANIARNNMKIPVHPTNSDEENDEFFNKLKNKIDKHLLVHSKENCKRLHPYQEAVLFRKKKSVLNEETQNVMKRFKKDRLNKTVTRTPSDTAMEQPNTSFNKVRSELHASMANIGVKNNISNTNIFTPNAFHIGSRSTFERPSDFLFYKTTQKETDILHTTIIETEIEEVFYNVPCFTPPSIESDEGNSIN